MGLPDETVVFPGHGYNDILFSTIGRERVTNPPLRYDSGREYAERLGAVEGSGNTPAVDATLDLNLQAHPALPESPGTVATCCASPGSGRGQPEIREVIPERMLDGQEALAERHWIDVRDPYEFKQGRIPGTTNIPLSELGFHLDELRKRGQVFLSCRSGGRSMTAARTLKYLDVVDEPVSVAGGILAWQALGFPIEGSPVA